MNKYAYKFNRNLSETLNSDLIKFDKLLYKKGLSDNTVTHYRCHINRIALFNNVEPNQLTIDHFDNYINDCTFVHVKSADYINQAISAGYLFYKYIRHINFNKELYSRRKKNTKLHHYLTYDEFISIGKKVTDFRVKLIMWLCYDAGLRSAEALNIKMSDIDYTNKRIAIIDSKNNKSRFTRISDIMERYLQTYIKKYRKNCDSNYLFPGTCKNRPLYYSNIELSFRIAARKAGFYDVSLHTLRHAFATMLYENGVAPAVIQTLLGHSNITTTHNYIVQSPSYLANLPSHFKGGN